MGRACTCKRKKGGKDNQNLNAPATTPLQFSTSTSAQDLKLAADNSKAAAPQSAQTRRGNHPAHIQRGVSAGCRKDLSGTKTNRQRPEQRTEQSRQRSANPQQSASMKFGKRLAAEAARRWATHYFDYKAIKKAIKDDIESKDALGANFQGVLIFELRKVSQFYSDKAAQLEVTLGSLPKGLHGDVADTEQLNQLRIEVQELIKFVALNYLAVVKAIKKRNRHLKETFGDAASTSLHALDLLGHEVFFTSPRLAALATQAEILYNRTITGPPGAGMAAKAPHCGAMGMCGTACGKGGAGAGAALPQQLLEEYQCPICLETLHNPVVLTCAHRFCWGCLVAHCTASRDNRLPMIKPVGASGKEGTPQPSYRVLEEIASSEEGETKCFYSCPVCRKPQRMDVESLAVDTNLSSFIEGLRLSIGRVNMSGEEPEQRVPWGIIGPQPRQHQGKLTVLLDVDGTLISSFTPRRAPRLPASVKTHVVGVGSKLNPAGVFVVERPGLRQFLEQLSTFAEVIIFTAGLEDYARPIVDALDPDNKFFSERIYREGCVKTEYYQCVKDMARVNRSLARTVLVDDTPLAFLHQPNNGVPVLGFRGDPDDRLLMEAVLPLLQVLDQETDVRDVLHRRFDMATWFKRHGFPVDQVAAESLEAAAVEREHAARLGLPCGQALTPEQMADTPAAAAAPLPAAEPAAAGAAAGPAPAPAVAPSRDWLLLSDIDRTLVDFSVCERVVEQLAPELLPMLVGIDPTSDAIPITNTMMAELQRRGVSRDQLLCTLQELGAELPPASLEMLRTAKRRRADVRIVSSNCNSVFLSHLLAGAKASGLVDEVTANPASFERVCGEAMADPSAAVLLGGGQQDPAMVRTPTSGSPTLKPAGSSQKLVVSPHHGRGAACAAPQRCACCPPGMCKGREVQSLKLAGSYRSILFCGEGVLDICPALALGPEDFVLARSGHALAEYIGRAAAAAAASGGQAGAGAGIGAPLQAVRAKVLLWGSQEDLAVAVEQLMAGKAM